MGNTPHDPLDYDGTRDLAKLDYNKSIPTKPMSEQEAECVAMQLADTINAPEFPSLIHDDGKFDRPRSRKPSYREAEHLGQLVAGGLTLEQAVLLLNPPLRYDKVKQAFVDSYKLRTIYQREQAKWLYKATQLLLTRPIKELGGLIFLLRNRHSRMFDAGRIIRAEITAPMQLTSPEVIARARLYANTPQVIDVDTIPMLTDTDASGSYVDINTLSTPTLSSSHLPNTTGINNTSFVSHNETTSSGTPTTGDTPPSFPNVIGEYTSSRSPILGDGGKEMFISTGENTSSGTPTAGGSTNAFEDIMMKKKPKIFQNEQHRINYEAYAKKKEARDAERARNYLEGLLNNPEPDPDSESEDNDGTGDADGVG